MKVLHLSAGSLSGGASRGAYWLHRALCELGIDSLFLTNSKEKIKDTSVISIVETPVNKFKSIFLPKIGSLPKLIYRSRKSWIFNAGLDGFDFTQNPAYKRADIIHLHWVNGLVAMRLLQKVKKPIVWTMRDMWPLTGGCHYSLDCNRYESGCGHCPQLGSSYKFDLSHFVVKNKSLSLPKAMRIVGISNWLTDCAVRSTVFKGYQVQTIGNNIDTRDFFPVDTNLARDILGLPRNKKIILIGAQSISDFYKGFDILILALDAIRHENYQIVLFGDSPKSVQASISRPVLNLGFIPDLASLRMTYSAADVFIAPSRMDAFGKTIAESMACGTPVVCFDATGPADIVSHRMTGYRAKPFDPLSLAEGVDWVLNLNSYEASKLRISARDRVVEYFDSRVIANQYIHLYEEML